MSSSKTIATLTSSFDRHYAELKEKRFATTDLELRDSLQCEMVDLYEDYKQCMADMGENEDDKGW